MLAALHIFRVARPRLVLNEFVFPNDYRTYGTNKYFARPNKNIGGFVFNSNELLTTETLNNCPTKPLSRLKYRCTKIVPDVKDEVNYMYMLRGMYTTETSDDCPNGHTGAPLNTKKGKINYMCPKSSGKLATKKPNTFEKHASSDMGYENHAPSDMNFEEHATSDKGKFYSQQHLPFPVFDFYTTKMTSAKNKHKYGVSAHEPPEILAPHGRPKTLTTVMGISKRPKKKRPHVNKKKTVTNVYGEIITPVFDEYNDNENTYSFGVEQFPIKDGKVSSVRESEVGTFNTRTEDNTEDNLEDNMEDKGPLWHSKIFPQKNIPDDDLQADKITPVAASTAKVKSHQRDQQIGRESSAGVPALEDYKTYIYVIVALFLLIGICLAIYKWFQRNEDICECEPGGILNVNNCGCSKGVPMEKCGYLQTGSKIIHTTGHDCCDCDCVR